jgi:CarD family transcriptional regulator
VAFSSVFWYHFRHFAGGSPAGVAVSKGRKGAGLYKVGDKVVYPHHGAGTVVKKEKREVLGEKREYLTIKILHNDMTVNVPSENAEKVGLRKVIGEDMVKVVVKALTGGGTQMPKNWNRRFKHNRDKMKTGDILELAEVVRNLSLRDSEKGLSTGEKQMFVKAKKILASELMYAKEMDEEATAEWLDSVLAGAETATNGAAPKKKTSPAAKASAKTSTTAKKAPAKKTTSAKAPAKKPAAKKATAGAR